MEPLPRPAPRTARDRRREGPQRRSCSTGSRPRRAAPACPVDRGLERRAVLATASASSTSATTPRRRALVVVRDVPAPDHGRPRQPVHPVPSRARCGCRSTSGRRAGVYVVRAGGVHDLDRGARARSWWLRAPSTRRACCCSRASARGATCERLGIEPVHDLPGVGENLIDHPESIIIWKLKRPMGPESVMDADCALFVQPPAGGRAARPDVPHYQLPFTFNTERLGYEVPDDRWCICMTPNVPRSRARGRLWLPRRRTRTSSRRSTSATSPTRTATTSRPSSTGCKIARKVAETVAVRGVDRLRDRARRRTCTSDEDLSTYGRAVAPHRLPPVAARAAWAQRRRPGGGRPGAARARHRRACRSPTARSSRR